MIKCKIFRGFAPWHHWGAHSALHPPAFENSPFSLRELRSLLTFSKWYFLFAGPCGPNQDPVSILLKSDIFETYLRGLSFLIQQYGGGREVRGVKNVWITASGGMKFFYILLRGAEKFPFCLSKTFTLNVGGQNIFILHARGLKIFVMLFGIRPPPYCGVMNDQPLNFDTFSTVI